MNSTNIKSLTRWCVVASWAMLGTFAAFGQPDRADGGRQDGGPVDHSDQDCVDDPPEYGVFPPGSDCGVIYVNQNATGSQVGLCWTDAFVDLQDALEFLNGNTGYFCEIWVARGTYTPDRGSGDRTSSFVIPEGVKIYGGFVGGERRKIDRNTDPTTNGTVLSGDLLFNDDTDPATRDDNGYHVVIMQGVSSDTVLDGFSIVAGQADGAFALAQDRGAGVYVDAADAQIGNSLVRECYADAAGAGVFMQSGTARFDRCEFSNNRAPNGAGMYIGASAAPSVTRCDFYYNTAFYRGGAIDNNASAALTVLSGRFYGNTAPAGGAIAGAGPNVLQLVNCLFEGNQADDGGAVAALTSSNLAVISCTFAQNTAQDTGGGVYLAPLSHADMRNSILWNNIGGGDRSESTQLHLDSTASVTVNYCCIDGWTTLLGGDGNSSENPEFCGPQIPVSDGWPGLNWRLRTGSPYIDAGINVPGAESLYIADPTVSTIPRDLDGQGRFIDDEATPDTGSGPPPLIDLGAYELHRSENSGQQSNLMAESIGPVRVPARNTRRQ